MTAAEEYAEMIRQQDEQHQRDLAKLAELQQDPTVIRLRRQAGGRAA